MISFVLENVHPHDIGTILDREGIAIRTGHHCAQPVMDRFGLPATARASFGLYNTREEVDALAAAIEKVRGGVRLMADLRDLYQEVILDHNKSPHNYREMPDATRLALGNNPLCGDKLKLYVRIEGDRIADVAFQGSGCAISKASASIMTDAVKGKSARGGRDAVREVPRPPHRAAGRQGRRRGPRQAGRLLRRPRVPRPRQVRDARVAHAGVGAEELA